MDEQPKGPWLIKLEYTFNDSSEDVSLSATPARGFLATQLRGAAPACGVLTVLTIYAFSLEDGVAP